jgi:hypothetical protein
MRLNVSVSPRVVGVVVCAALIVAGFLTYRWWYSSESYIEADTWVKAARFELERPTRERLAAGGKSEAEIEQQVAEMWKRGDLRLPPGKPGIDWAVTPGGGIRMLPKPEDLIRGAAASAPATPGELPGNSSGR